MIGDSETQTMPNAGMACPTRKFGEYVNRFSSDDRGNVYLMFALLFIPLVMVSIAALDFGRANGVQQELQTALDSGLSFAANQLVKDDDEVKRAFLQAFKASLPQTLRDTPAALAIDRENRKLSASANTHIPVNLIGVLKDNRFEIAASSELAIATPKSPIAQLKRTDPEAAREMQDAEARVRELIARQFPQLDGDYRDSLASGTVDAAAIERMAQQILQQLGR